MLMSLNNVSSTQFSYILMLTLSVLLYTPDSASNVCTVRMPDRTLQLGQLILCAVTATSTPTVLPHSIYLIEQVCPTVKTRLNDADRWRGKG